MRFMTLEEELQEDREWEAAQAKKYGVTVVDMASSPPPYRYRQPPHEVGSSEDRFWERREKFEHDGKPYGRVRHDALWVLHNAVAHPLLGFFPGEHTAEFHELTSRWLNKAPRWRHVRLPPIPSMTKWIVHNCVVHPLIGLLPVGPSFDLHDKTARTLGVPGWV